MSNGNLEIAGTATYLIAMRLTVEIADEVLADLCRILHVKKNEAAVAAAVAEFVRCEKARDFALLLRKGELDYPATNEEVEKLHG
jgi:Arc/MetJ family transcription regulator